MRPAHAVLAALAAALAVAACSDSKPGPLAPACAAANALAPGVVFTGTLEITPGVINPSCRYTPTDPPLAERIFTYTAASSGPRTASTDFDGTNVDTILTLLATCSERAAELGCAEDIDTADPPLTNLRSVLQFDAVAGSTYTIVLQASSGTLWNDPADVPDLPYTFELHLD